MKYLAVYSLIMKQIIFHETEEYKRLNTSHLNGAYYYAKEIYDNIIPKIRTKRPFVLLHITGKCFDNAIVFVHNNLNPERYLWMLTYSNLIFVCSQESTMQFMIEAFPKAHSIYLPLSVDVKYVEKFKVEEKTKDTAYVGRAGKPNVKDLPKDIDYLSELEREDLLKEMAKYKNVYAVGRCAIEAKILGCNILPFDERYPNPEIWQILDNKDVIDYFQQKLDEIVDKF